MQACFRLHGQAGIGARLNEETGHVEIIVDDRQMERRGILLIALVEIQLGIEFYQQFNEIPTLEGNTEMDETVSGVSHRVDV